MGASARAALAECLELLKRAEDAYRGKDLNGGWSLLLEAQRSEIGALDDEQRHARAIALRAEAGKKLPEWRKAAAAELLQGKEGESVHRIKEATLVRNEHFHNQYHKLDLARQQIIILTTILFAALTSLVAVVGLGLFRIGELRTGDLGWLDLVTVMLLGAVGGALSAVRSLTGRPERRIPEELADWPVTALRPLLGAAAATGVALMAQAGVVRFGPPENQQFALLAVAFLAGFSERWFLGIIGGVPGVTSERG
jgi:hypothetical protein